MPVKEVLYSSAFDAPLFAGILWRHLQKYIDRQFVELGRTNALIVVMQQDLLTRFCINANGQREPVAHLTKHVVVVFLDWTIWVRAKRAVVSAPAKQLIFWALPQIMYCIWENCEVEDFGLRQRTHDCHMHRKMFSVQYCWMNAAR